MKSKNIQKLKRKKPVFTRHEWFSVRALGIKWRRPRGRHNKMRKHIKGKGEIPNTGWGSPKEIRGLHPSGFKDILVSNLLELEIMDPKKHAIRLRKSIGRKKGAEISKIAKEKGFRVLNYKKPVSKKSKKEVSKAPKASEKGTKRATEKTSPKVSDTEGGKSEKANVNEEKKEISKPSKTSDTEDAKVIEEQKGDKGGKTK